MQILSRRSEDVKVLTCFQVSKGIDLVREATHAESIRVHHGNEVCPVDDAHLDDNGVACKYCSGERVEYIVERVVPWHNCTNLQQYKLH